MTVQATSAQTIRALRGVRIDNEDREFNCQTWVQKALHMFKNVRYLPAVSYDAALDGMVDAISEAKDVEE